MSAGQDQHEATLLQREEVLHTTCVSANLYSNAAEAVHSQTMQHMLATYKRNGWHLNAPVNVRKGAF